MRRLVRRERLTGWGALAAILTLLITASTLGLGSSPAHSQGGVFPLPADAGTVWVIAAGYNTGSHSVADGNDPHAIDIVREDRALTAESVVRSPIAGTVSYVSNDCLTIDNGAGLAVLLCHLFPDHSLYRGLPVEVGHDLGPVAPAYHANNGGLPHIHLAVHHTTGGGRLGGSIPLIGAWALEGIDLPDTGQFNTHAGTRFTSSNGNNPAQSPAPAPGSESDADDRQNGPSSDQSTALLVLQPGWNMIGWTARTPAAEIAAALGDAVGVIFAFDADAQSYRRFAPGRPARVNDLTEVVPGDGLLILIEDGPGAVLPRPANGTPLVQNLREGFNLVAWTGAAAMISEAMTSLDDALVAAFWWDPGAQDYRTYRPGLPMFSDLAEVGPAQALWIQLDADAVWDPAAGAPADPAAGGGDPETSGPDLLQVLGTTCLNLRPAPTTNGATPITCLPPGTILQSLGDTEVAAGHNWVKVRVRDSGQIGWVASEYTMPYQPPGTAGPGDNSGTDSNGPPGDAIAGEATFYHHALNGNPMFCGGVYDPRDPTIAASTTYDCGARLRVWRGARFVDVVVQDTGAFPVHDIDLSPAAFEKLGSLAEGRIPVRVEVLP